MKGRRKGRDDEIRLRPDDSSSSSSSSNNNNNNYNYNSNTINSDTNNNNSNDNNDDKSSNGEVSNADHSVSYRWATLHEANLGSGIAVVTSNDIHISTESNTELTSDEATLKRTKPTTASWDLTERASDDNEIDDYHRETFTIYFQRTKNPCFHHRRLIAAVIMLLVAVGIGIALLYYKNQTPVDPLQEVTRGNTLSPTLSPTYIPVTPSNITVGVYYYPWYFSDFHFNTSYLRKELDPPQNPQLGEYNDHEPAIISQHLAWSRQANIKLWVSSWWGPDRREDEAILKILQHRELGNSKIALLYESTGLIMKKDVVSTDHVAADMDYICQHYFSDGHYFTIENRPVLFVYLTRKLHDVNILGDVVALMRSQAAKRGFNVYIIGDQVFADAPNDEEGAYTPFDLLDGVTGYDAYGSILSTRAKGGDPIFYAGMDHINDFVQQSRDWKRLASLQSCTFIPAVTPGYNDRGKRLDANHSSLSRRLTERDEHGSLFRALLDQARFLVDASTSNLLMVNSFNEWHEDTQIEPVVGESTVLPFDLTQGVEYQGYGELYLNILRNMTEDEGEEQGVEWDNSTTNVVNMTDELLNSTTNNLNSTYADSGGRNSTISFTNSTSNEQNTTFGVLNATNDNNMTNILLK